MEKLEEGVSLSGVLCISLEVKGKVHKTRVRQATEYGATWGNE